MSNAISSTLQALIDQEKYQEALDMIIMVESRTGSSLDILKLKSQVAYAAKDFETTINTNRLIAEREPSSATGLMGTNHILISMSDVPAVIGDFAPGLNMTVNPPKFILAAMPKSGSTFVFHTMTKLHGMMGYSFMFRGDQSEQELQLPNMVSAVPHSAAIQQHFRATESNVQLLQAFQIKPVVLIRNIFDCLVSMTDMLETSYLPVTFFQNEMRTWDRQARLEAVVCKWAHWYVEFYASWMNAAARKRLPILTVRYEDLMADKVGHFRQMGTHCGLSQKSDTEITAMIESVEAEGEAMRINKGTSGRGSEQLSDNQKAFVMRIADVYRGQCDLSPIGL